MPRGRSLHIGLNRVDPGHYGSALPLAGCHRDARDMARIVAAKGFESITLLDEDASARGVLRAIGDVASVSRAGDTFVLTYAGHGAQMPDADDGESDGLDETWVLFDRMVVDDEIFAALARFARGVRILFVSDSCHSGTIARATAAAALLRAADGRSIARPTFRTPDELGFGGRVLRAHPEVYAAARRSTPRRARELVQASIVQISGCQDDEVSADGSDNGLFTGVLKAVWDEGRFVGDHRELWKAIARRMPTTQNPNLLSFGLGAAEFERSRPFTFENPSVPPLTTGAAMPTIDDPHGNWSEVYAELERRVPGRVPAFANTLGRTPDLLGAPLPTSLAGAPSSHVGSFVSGAPSATSTRAISGPPIVRTFFWGFHIEISSASLAELIAVADPVNAIVASIGPLTGPATPFVALGAAFVAGALQLLKGLDRGAGVYVSMSWFAPGIFIPTTVPTRSLGRSAAARGTGEPYEQAGDTWYRDYGGGLFGLRLDEDILWNLPNGTVRERVIVNLNPPSFGNVFPTWLSDDPSVGHFRLHVGVAAFQGGRVNLRMMIRDATPRSVDASQTTGPRSLTEADVASNGAAAAPTNGARA